ncbi:alpha/beta hydrolase [Paenibacillus sp. IB182496]|uniref:Alpha/beta hydrolase n=1 Tax=Paenibacillus sabuli TaxID=2772509 RepID=A0A927BSY6_9BACL|nr:alpha/beta hydrolase [Paenibacillus sabuli]MBD2845722.1 alpha/beta hydrolase [Paenibacillus sabuli]
MERHFHIRSAPWELAATLHYPPEREDGRAHERLPAVVICHGFLGSRIGENRLFVKAARYLSGLGYMVLRFDYAGCGESEGEYGEGGLDALVEQTRLALDYALDIDLVDPERVILLGHSLGGAVALLTAAADKRVKRLVMWAPVAHPFTDIVGITGRAVFDDATIQGSADYLGYRFTPAYFESLTAHQPLRELSRFGGDVLLVHGTSDEVIPVDYTFLYQKVFWTRSEGQCDKEIILQGDHAFSTQSATEQALAATARWLEAAQRRLEEWDHWSI